jgi:hypothetical protein
MEIIVVTVWEAYINMLLHQDLSAVSQIRIVCRISGSHSSGYEE